MFINIIFWGRKMKKTWIKYILIFLAGFLSCIIFVNTKIDITVNVSPKQENAQVDSVQVDSSQEQTVQQETKTEENVVSGKTPLTQKELISIVSKSFVGNFHTVGGQAPVEYVGKHIPINSGCSIDNWLKPAMNYLSTNAILINDESSYFALNDEPYKETLLSFIPDIYELDENGIYVIDNDGIFFLYIKTNSKDYEAYIDYLFVNSDVEIPSYQLYSKADDAHYTFKEPAFDIYPVDDFYHDSIFKGAVFNGFFYNIDHSNPSVFLKNGPQTKNNDHQEVLSQFNDNKDLSTLTQIYKYISEGEYHFGEGEKFARTVDEIMESKILTGCTDYGLIFASLARDKGIPTVFLQTARADWIFDRVREDDQGIVGHILIEVYIEGKWRLVDSTAGRYYPDYDISNFSLNDGYYVFSKSIEVLDSGISNEQENFNNMREIFKHFNVDAYNDPLYTYIELSTGTTRKATPFVFGQQTVVQASDAN